MSARSNGNFKTDGGQVSMVSAWGLRKEVFGKLAFLAVTVIMFLSLEFSAYARCGIETWFEDEEFVLNVYRVCGEKAGKTLMIIGGIQGDEPGGFLAADHYADIRLRQGNLILIPRANLPSIMESRRQIHVDMNRSFGESSFNETYERSVTEVLQALMAESDLLLNLHDGSGFFSPTWLSEDRNPLRYGQSIIADASRYRKENGDVLMLETIATEVVERMNRNIENPDHHFHFNNHRTLEDDSPHWEQRRSATFYALTHRNIPAFGVEASKSLPMELKIKHHILAINAFMDFLGIIPETPPVRTEPPALGFLVIAVEGQTPVAVEKNQILQLSRGSIITVSHIVSNYSRGFSVRIDGFDGRNYMGQPVVLNESTRIRVFKDHQPCGSVGIDIREKVRIPDSVVRDPEDEALRYEVRINERIVWLEDGATLDVPYGAIMEIVSVTSGKIDPVDLIVNFKGFVPDVDVNTGEDRGYPIDTAKDLWVRYSEGREGLVYPVETSLYGKRIGGFRVRLVP
ncbi:M14/M99 family metallopeptidase [Desulfobotulus sp. H1]|uniref:M14/M99 family metallopeptidase n=1 Tax=Desulfobotulus pelophilus TaxID=2823377 RepID=A0ABT3N5L2_9BACT|nr:M14/M99 family metallopeptidase [Desulfobotulus pelophilus]MCW7752756.1 M14/M99 family metallopeptidase [Desulfobotulus pelophilus]